MHADSFGFIFVRYKMVDGGMVERILIVVLMASKNDI